MLMGESLAFRHGSYIVAESTIPAPTHGALS